MSNEYCEDCKDARPAEWCQTPKACKAIRDAGRETQGAAVTATRDEKLDELMEAYRVACVKHVSTYGFDPQWEVNVTKAARALRSYVASLGSPARPATSETDAIGWFVEYFADGEWKRSVGEPAGGWVMTDKDKAEWLSSLFCQDGFASRVVAVFRARPGSETAAADTRRLDETMRETVTRWRGAAQKRKDEAVGCAYEQRAVLLAEAKLWLQHADVIESWIEREATQ